ncbi:MAG: hypothetical protein KAT68_09390 [Bacteroidales bacterium]|nr:hypothetical protein [Bacteroidales bacterium]
MDINKIKDFNQKVLAIFGSLAIVLIAIVIIWTITEYFRSMSYNRYNDEPEIVSNEKAQENYDKNIRTHQVSFESFRLVDTINNVYLIPVSQSALKLEEYISKKDKSSNGTLGLLDMYGGYSDFYYDYRSYNNALIYDSRDTSIQKLFESRLSINRINIEKIAGKPFVLIAATDKDTNKDDILDASDSKTLYIYSVDSKTLTEIKSKNTDFVDYKVISGKEQLIIKYGLDKDKNGTYNWDEPMIMKLYSIRDNKLSDLIASDLINELQNTLDGKN